MPRKAANDDGLIKAIAKLEKNNGKTTPILFFPETKTNPGCIGYWSPSEGHGEASLGYFWELRNPEEDVATATIAQYEQLHQCKLDRVARDTYQMRMARWAA